MTGCIENDMPNSPNCNNIDETSLEKTGLLDPLSNTLSSSDALIVANKFRSNDNSPATRTSSNAIVSSLKGENGEDLLFVVNYAQNNGYVIISASKNFQPVLAYSDTGNFDISEAIQTDNPFIMAYKNKIESVIEIESDSLRTKYAINWQPYEKLEEIQTRSTLPSNIEAIKENARAQYTALGYECFDMSAVPAFISPTTNEPNRAQDIINDICSHTYSAYDCMEVDMFLLKRINRSRGPILQTLWGQSAPYCGTSNNGYAGCAVIALAQIMKYYEWPNWYEWDNIPISATSYNPILTDYIDDIKSRLNAVEFANGTGVSETNLLNGIVSEGYSYTISQYNGMSSQADYVMSNNPVLLLGETKDGQAGHAWICDGYDRQYVEYSFMMFIGPRDYEFHLELIDTDEEYIHMNMCLANPEATWYYINGCDFNFRILKECHLTPERQ